MWKCFGCGRHLSIVRNDVTGLTCPYCGSRDVTRIEEGSSLAKEAIANNWGHFYSPEVQEPYSYQVKSEVSTLDYGAISSVQKDGFILNGLKRCGVDYPTMFSLLWGDNMAKDVVFPAVLRKLVTDIIQEIERKEKSYDLAEKKLHGIIINLLYVLYEKQVNDIVERAKEQAKLYK